MARPSPAAAFDPPPRLRGRPRGDAGGRATADRILDAAIGQFAQGGFAETQLRAIAAEAGVDVALIAHRFGSKLALWHAAIDRLAQGLVATLGPACAAARDASGIAGLRHAVERLVDYLCDTPALALFLQREVAQPNARSVYSDAHLVQPLRAMLTPLLRPLADDDDEADLLFVSIAGGIVAVVAARPLLTRLAPGTAAETAFRRMLKRVALRPFDPFPSIQDIAA